MLWLYEQYLLILATYGDPRAWRRLRAISRLRTRWEIQDLRSLCQAARELGINPSIIIQRYIQGKLAILRGFQK